MSTQLPARWRAWRAGRPVLEARDMPGVLSSASLPPPRPGEPVPTHPFASIRFLTAEDEGDLGRILRESTSPEDFRARLRRSGYEVDGTER